MEVQMNRILNAKNCLKQKCTNNHRASKSKMFHASTCFVCPSKYSYVKTNLNCRGQNCFTTNYNGIHFNNLIYRSKILAFNFQQKR